MTAPAPHDRRPELRGLRWEVTGSIGILTLDRPPVNAFDWQQKRSLLSVLESLAADDTIRSVVFASALPRTFCAGSDLRELAEDHDLPGSALERTRFELAMWERLSSLPQVSIAAIDGHALGSGFELCVACDFRVAGSGASFALPEIKIGGGPGAQTLSRLTRMVGLGAARRLLLLGDSVTAIQADSMGLVDVLVEAGGALAAATRLAERMAAQPPSSLRYLRRALSAGISGDLERVERVVLDDADSLFTSPEMREGIQAFLERRPPDFAAAVTRDRAKDR